MKFSVVISVYNKAKFVANTIQSVLSQTYQDFEIVIVNDGSTDESEAEIFHFKDERIRYIFQENQGAGGARNTAIKAAKYDYIALLDADDYWYPFFLEEIKKSIEKFPEEYVFATAMQKKIGDRVFDKDYSVDFKNEEIIKVDFFEASFLSSILSSSSTVLHRDVFHKIGFYNPSIKSGQDTDFFIRVGLQFNIVFSTKTAVQHIARKNSLSVSTVTLKDKANFKAYEKLEKNNSALKKYLDLNRFSLCILAKLDGDREGFQKLYEKIDLNNLNKKQRFLLNQNRLMLRSFLKIKENVEKLGLRWSAFK